ncbi:hypothetical protein K1719_026621 [Acacia pycnantha]|nr:hypothetical protein K1719_026621 [Acacia pycnantha]
MSDSEVEQITNSKFPQWFRSYFMENPSDRNEIAWSLSYGAAIVVTRCKKYRSYRAHRRGTRRGLWRFRQPLVPSPLSPSLLFNSHLDSVPAKPSKWIHPPFAVVRTLDGRIYACGAQDDECIGMKYLEGIRNLKEKDFTPIRTIHLSCVLNEEIGGFEGASKFSGSKEFEHVGFGRQQPHSSGFADSHGFRQRLLQEPSSEQGPQPFNGGSTV